jgi:hypothetical protein
MFYNLHSITQITNNSIDDERPATGFNQVTWTANLDGDYDIFFYDGSTTRNISSNNVHDEFLFMDGLNIASRSNVNPEGEIFFASPTAVWQLTYNNFKEFSPKGHIKRFMWSGESSGSGDDEEIYSISKGSDNINLQTPTSTSFSPGTQQKIDFEAYGFFDRGTIFSAQLSTLNSETFPAQPLVLATSSKNQMTFNVPNLPPGVYYLRIVSSSGAISNTIPITILQLPNVFVTSPVDGAINQKVKLNLTSKAVSGASAYTFELTTQGNTPATVITQTGARIQLVDSLHYNTVYSVRVKTNLNSAYGKTTTFTTAPSENFAYAISPANGATNIGMKVNVTANLVLYATSYTMELNTDSLFSTSSAIVKSGGRLLSFNNLSTSTTYYVRIKTNLSPKWGKTHSFTTGPALIFSYIISPANNATDVSTILNVKANNITGASTYKLQLCTSSDFVSSPIIEKIVTTNTALFTGLKYNTKYFARLSTDLASGWGNITSFTTKTAFSLAYVKSPAENATNQPLKLVIKSNVVPGATHYTIELNTAPDFTGKSLVQSSSSNSVTFTSLSPNTTYYNRVKTELDNSWGSIRKFTTSEQIPLVQEIAFSATTRSQEEITIVAYPNRFSEVLNVTVNSPYEDDVEISLIDFAGQVFESTNVSANTEFQIRNAKLKPGLYILSIKSKGIVRTIRVIKE